MTTTTKVFKTVNGIFHELTSKRNEVLELEESIKAAKLEVKLLSEEIVNHKDKGLQQALLTTGIRHDCLLFKKAIRKPQVGDKPGNTYLNIQEYIEPPLSSQIDGRS